MSILFKIRSKKVDLHLTDRAHMFIEITGAGKLGTAHATLKLLLLSMRGKMSVIVREFFQLTTAVFAGVEGLAPCKPGIATCRMIDLKTREKT
jgi:hypothetical protein